MAYGPSVEYRVFQSFSAKLIDAITSKAEPNLFANLLVEGGFLSRRSADNKISANGLSNYVKVCNLISVVDPAIKIVATPEKKRENFNKFLILLCHENLELNEFAQQLAEKCRAADPSYEIPSFLQHPGGSSNTTSSSTPTANKMDEKPTLAQLIVLKGSGHKAEVIKTVAPSWKYFGALLDFDDDGKQLDVIEAMESHHSPLEYCQAMFRHWLSGNGVQPVTWRTLVELLRDFDQKHVAETIEKIFGVTS